MFYTDHGSDFTSKHMEQVADDLDMELIFSQVQVPRGPGKIERFFRSVNELFLQDIPGHDSRGIAMSEQPETKELVIATHPSIPRSVQDAMSQRTRCLSQEARQLLTLAAVTGRRFDVSVLQRLLRCKASQLVGLLQEVVAAQLVVEEFADRFA